MSSAPRRVKPGWYLLAALFVYALVVTVMLQRTNAEVRDLRIAQATAVQEDAAAPSPAAEPAGLWVPLPGASLPQDDAHLPGAERPYRDGVNQGFDFYDGEVGVPVPYGAPVIAAAAGVVERVDQTYSELSPATFEGLLADVADGASDEELDLLRGRQVWIRTPSGRLLRYAHLSDVRNGLAVGQDVFRGQVVGFVGNSGTDAGVAGTNGQARLHFEVWTDGTFFGENLEPDEVRMAATSLFTGP